ncbi:cytochrome [Niastella koreensis]|uniref:DUF805 domain-containing protein n=2 Tax=Niastella koreensis TaxID=354356 RepID=G8TA93_NIAKG|nr:DUF805 domain-containing protein [Niastella koreensis]AEV97040.1 protein of unknown function DUF805 [Niastella koreensis GR20-10]OQP39270.1 cytochrome [Niastella koreensis]
MKWYIDVLKKYAVFNGRARRSEYWYFVLFNLIISIVLAVGTAAIRMPFLYSVYSLAVMLPSLAVAVRRMHDVNKSGWYILIPIYNLILACTEGTSGPNSYGDDPKNEFLNEIDQWGENTPA